MLFSETGKSCFGGVVTSRLAVRALPLLTLPFDPLGPGGGGVCPSFAAKGRRNRLIAIYELPCHQRVEPFWSAPLRFASGVDMEERDRFSGAFDCIRLIAAFAVLYSHCYPLLGHNDAEPLHSAGTSFGAIAVYGFFAISGYLVTQSWLRDPSMSRFMMRRVLRIFPALIFVIIASFVIVGPLTTTLGMKTYFSEPTAWSYLAKILIYPAQYGLPGVFDDNPFPSVVNGSLWTLRLEFSLYILIAILGVSGTLGCRWTGITIALVCLTVDMTLPHVRWLDRFPFIHQISVLFSNAVPFFVATALAQNAISRRWLWSGSLLLTAITVSTVHTAIFEPFFLLALPTLVITIGRYGCCSMSGLGDYSYGVYLWSFVIQQTTIHFFPAIAPAGLFIVAGGASLFVAAISWHLIEKNALQLKPKGLNRPNT